MNPLKHYHNISIPVGLEAKLDKLTDIGLLRSANTPLNPNASTSSIPDGFYPDGKPVSENPDFLFPCYAPFYLGTPYPSTLASVPDGYSRTAAIAALEWLEKTLENPLINRKHFDAEVLTATIDGNTYQVAFPNTIVRFVDGDPNYAVAYRERYAAVVTIADVSDNNQDWEDGTIPFYAESQARFLLWSWDMKYGDMDECPTDCFVVRITGNTPGDITVRVVHADPQKDSTVVKRICKRMAGKSPAEISGNIRNQGTWFERKEQERQDAYVIQDEEFYELVRSYMEVRTLRKTLESESKKLKEQMDAIAIRLASMTGTDRMSGQVQDTANGRSYKVGHMAKRVQSVTVSPDLIRQYYPEHASCIHINEVPRGRITIEAE